MKRNNIWSNSYSSVLKKAVSLLLCLLLTASCLSETVSYAETGSADAGEQFTQTDPNPNDIDEPGEVSPQPEITPEPERTPEPEGTPEPEITPEPEGTPEPETSPEPEKTPGPETTPEPGTILEQEGTLEPEKSYEETAMALLRKVGLGAAFSGGTIKPEFFTAKLGGQATTIPGDWPGLQAGALYNADGSINSELFPKFPGFHIVAALMHGTPVRFVGILMHEGVTYIYYSTSLTLELSVVTVLAPGETITLQYEQDEFKVTYTLSGQIPDGFTVDSAFGADRPTSTTNHRLSFQVKIPRGFFGFVSAGTVNLTPTGDYGSSILGLEPTYTQTSTGARIDTSKTPTFFSLKGDYSLENLRGNQTINLLLFKRDTRNSYQFDPHFWVNAPSTKEVIVTDAPDLQFITPEGGSNFYSFSWKFNTQVFVGDWRSWMVQTLYINGEQVSVPIYPNPANSSTPNASLTTVLSTGTEITVTLEKITLDPIANLEQKIAYDRYYSLTATNAAENLTITGGAVIEATSFVSGFQLSLIDSTGVEVQYYARQGGGRFDWVSKSQNDVTPLVLSGNDIPGSVVYGNFGTSGEFSGNVRFRPKPGFGAPASYSFTSYTGRELDDGKFFGPDKDGWYYIQLKYHPNDPGQTRLSIRGVQLQYMVQYLPGSPENGQVEGMPEFDNGPFSDAPENTDANGGSFYKFSGSPTMPDTVVPIASPPHNVPDLGQSDFIPDTFLGWEVLDSGGEPVIIGGKPVVLQPGSFALLSELVEFAGIFDQSSNIYVIRLRAKWQSNTFRYFIDLCWTVPDGAGKTKTLTQFAAAEVVLASKAQLNDQSLKVVISPTADVITLFLKSHPGYRLTTPQTLVFEVFNEDHIMICFEPIPSNLEVKKLLEDENGDSILSPDPFMFSLTLSFPDGAVEPDGSSLAGKPLGSDYDGTYPYTVTSQDGSQQEREMDLSGGHGTFYLMAGQTAVFASLPAGVKYAVTETGTNGCVVDEPGNSTGLLPESPTTAALLFKNRHTVDLTIRKLATGSGAGEGPWHFTLTLTDGTKSDTQSFALSGGEEYTVEDLPVGTRYTVTEAEADKDGYTTMISGAEETDGGTASGVLREAEATNGITVTFINEKSLGNLIISKLVAGEGGSAHRYFSFTLTLTAPTGVTLEKSYPTLNAEGESGMLELKDGPEPGNKTATFTLCHDDVFIIEGLPAGTIFTVTEEKVDISPAYTVYVAVDGGEPVESRTARGMIPYVGSSGAPGNSRVAFANVREADTSLTISKQVMGDVEPGQEWIFDVLLHAPEGQTLPGSLLYSDVSGTQHSVSLSDSQDGESFVLSLASGESVTITGLPVGTTYMVTEREAGKNWYTTTITGADSVQDGTASGILRGGMKGVELLFTNSRDTGTLILSKTVTGDGGSKTQEFIFKIKLTAPEGVRFPAGYAYTDAQGGTGTLELSGAGKTRSGVLRLKHGDTVTIPALPAGVEYTVTEDPVSGYTAKATGSHGVIEGTVQVSFTNHWSAAPVTGDEAEPGMWAAGMLLSAAGIVLLLRARKRRMSRS